MEHTIRQRLQGSLVVMDFLVLRLEGRLPVAVHKGGGLRRPASKEGPDLLDPVTGLPVSCGPAHIP